jgi:hypothetical protein
MQAYRQLRYYTLLYLVLWGLNHLIYYEHPRFQQHPEAAFSVLNLLPPPPRPLPIQPLALRVTALKIPRVRGRPDHLELGRLRATVYHAVPAECDSHPLETADGSHINPARVNELRWCAVSQDLLHHRGGPLRYGDTLRVRVIPSPTGTKAVKNTKSLGGLWVVHDAMNARHRRRIDFLVSPRSGYDPDQRTVLVRRVWKHQPKKSKPV